MLLATGPGPEEAVQLVLHAPGSLRRLPLQDLPRHQLALLLDHRFHGRCAERADQLVLEVGLAGEEPQLLEPGTVRDRARGHPRSRPRRK